MGFTHLALAGFAIDDGAGGKRLSLFVLVICLSFVVTARKQSRQSTREKTLCLAEANDICQQPQQMERCDDPAIPAKHRMALPKNKCDKNR